MSVSCKMIKVLNKFTATFKDSTIPDNSDEIIFGFERSATSFSYLRNTEITKNLSFQNCIIPSIPEYLITKLAHLEEIEVIDSIIGGIDLKSLKKLKNLQKFTLKNSTIEEHTGTVFEGFKNLTFNFKKSENGDKFVFANVEGVANLEELENEDADNEASSSSSEGICMDLKPKITSLGQYRQLINQKPQSSFNFVLPDSTKQSYVMEKPQQTSFRGIFDPLNVSGNSSNTLNPKRTCGHHDTDHKTPKKSSDFEHKAMLKDRNLKLQTMNVNLTKELNILREQIMKLEVENKKLTENGILADLKKIFNDEVFKDFSVSVNNEKSYKVHKILFAARSSIIANMIRNTPDAENLDLQDIPLPIFDILLDFIYNDTPPEDDDRLIEIYAAAGKLNIVELKNMTSLRLMDKVNDKNAFKILELSNRYGNDELRLKAFEEIKKTLSDYNLRDEFSKNPDKIKKLLEMKRKMDEEFEKMQQEIDGIQVIDDEEKNKNPGSPTANSDDYEVVD